MKTTHKLIICLLGIVLLPACNNSANKMESYEKGTFGYDLNFLLDRDSLVVLKNSCDAQVIVSAKYQGKVFTSTAEGKQGKSLGFVKYDAFDYETPDTHMNAFGGENRFWLGPEGGQYSIYFKPETQQIFDHWHTPAAIDTEAWTLVSADDKKAVLSKEIEVLNYRGTLMKLNVDRSVELYETEGIESVLGVAVDPKVKSVGYKTDNVITNLNDFEWTEQTGTICIWMLDMFIPSERAVTIIPYNEGDEKEIGVAATTNYFGEIPADRLKMENGVLYFKTDGKFRSKLGMSSARTKGIAGNYDPLAKRLTVATYDVQRGATYLNQEWDPGKNPLVGDAMNAYNDGPVEDGSIMGPFLEVESASPAAFLKPEQSLSHTHSVFHFIGEMKDLELIAEKLLGVSLQKVLTVL